MPSERAGADDQRKRSESERNSVTCSIEKEHPNDSDNRDHRK